MAVTASGSSGRERHGRHSPNISVYLTYRSLGLVTVGTAVNTFGRGSRAKIGACLWCGPRGYHGFVVTVANFEAPYPKPMQITGLLPLTSRRSCA